MNPDGTVHQPDGGYSTLVLVLIILGIVLLLILIIQNLDINVKNSLAPLLLR